MRLPLKWKFGLLMASFVLTISTIILINFRAAGKVEDELSQVQEHSFPQFTQVTATQARFRTLSRLVEDTVVKDSSSDDRVRLEGFTAAVLVKKGQSPDALIREMRDLIQQATGSGVSA